MTKFFKIASIVYRLLIGLLLIFSTGAILMVGSAGHSSNLRKEEFLFFAVTALTIILLTVYQNIDKSNKIRTALRYSLTILFFVTIAFEIYSIYETYFICKCFTKADHITSLTIFLFGILTTIVLTGLVKDKL